MDEELLSALAHFQEEIERLSQKFKELQSKTYELYKENEELRQENKELRELALKKKEVEAEDDFSPQAFEYLSHLYEEEYHICPLSFGEKRDRDCLFCRELLERQQKNEGE
ncbi:initiation control protein YabA [Halarsenatibacter silvermanii]|uniref:Regulator of replication initiation timing n=1 Tax=Halarsenatibacter silvermanii TaxID=321763 RepID=A0A1G9R0T7_9FIRM|nr:initiation control protein YabA [Halarsenatibacter silvermanii]SDM16075.1 Regulator of replication initiation timing [Halarsenatibacter silvermanii]